VEGEGGAGFRYVHGPEVSRPFEDVLKNVVVDRLNVA